MTKERVVELTELGELADRFGQRFHQVHSRSIKTDSSLSSIRTGFGRETAFTTDREIRTGSEKLSDAQLELLELEPGVSSAEVEAESERAQLKLCKRMRLLKKTRPSSLFDRVLL
jgi:hypothetical protein